VYLARSYQVNFSNLNKKDIHSLCTEQHRYEAKRLNEDNKEFMLSVNYRMMRASYNVLNSIKFSKVDNNGPTQQSVGNEVLQIRLAGDSGRMSLGYLFYDIDGNEISMKGSKLEKLISLTLMPVDSNAPYDEFNSAFKVDRYGLNSYIISLFFDLTNPKYSKFNVS